MIRAITIVFLLACINLSAQVRNNDCFDAEFINDVSDYCSGPEIFTITGATQSEIEEPGCWTEEGQSDVWYSFTARNTGLFFQISGQSENNTESLGAFSFALYEGRCTNPNLVICGRSRSGINIIERTLDNLTVGRVYYLRVASNSANVGTFELCTSSFNTIPSAEQDCPTAVVLCDKSPFVIEFLTGGGVNNTEAAGTCLDNDLGGIGGAPPSETSSAWYKWTAATSGSLTFTMTPNNINDPEEDLDFVVFRLPRGIDNCSDKQPIRCMASGESQGNSAAQNAPCFGPTGLRLESTDTEELAGCMAGDDNFLAALDMVAGESYALLINNYSQSGFGFTISFGGTGTFLGPEPEFSVEAETTFECNLPILFNDQTLNVAGDNITEYIWNFGEGASPQTGNGSQEQRVVYNSFGTKFIALTVMTDRGCTVTKIKEIEIEPCCLPDNDLSLSTDVTDLNCYESEDGEVRIDGVGGQPEYLFSFDNGDFRPRPNFNELSAGTYTVKVQDAYGCEVTDQITVDQPAPLTLTISGPTDSLELGQTAIFSATSGPAGRDFTYLWTPDIGLSCNDCPDPTVTSSGSRTYTLTATDEDGCMISADINLISALVRNFYAPNALSVSSTLGNDQFKIITGVSALNIEEVNVYDRWGGILYHAEDIIYSDEVDGWDGTVNGEPVNAGAYAWSASIRYVDDVVLYFAGTITVIR